MIRAYVTQSRYGDAVHVSAVAHTATAGSWEIVEVDDYDDYEIRSDQSPDGRPRTEFRWAGSRVYERADADHIARWDPGRVLAEAAAKRKLLALHTGADHACIKESVGTTVMAWYADSDPCPTLRLSAAPYAGRDGWKPEWGADD